MLSILSPKYSSKLSAPLSILLFTVVAHTTVSCLDFYSSFVAAVLASYLVSAHIAKLISHHFSAGALHSCYVSLLLGLYNISSSFLPQGFQQCSSRALSCSWLYNTEISPIRFLGLRWKYLTLNVKSPVFFFMTFFSF